MVVDCTSLCLLAIAVGLKASLDTEKCSYCMDVRGLSPDCDADPMSCVDQDPNSLIYCLTINELPRHSDHIRRVVRCLSHSAFNISMDELHDAMVLRECHFDTMRHCDCPNCRQNVPLVTPTGHPRQIFKSSTSSEQQDDLSDLTESIIQLENSVTIQEQQIDNADVIAPTSMKGQTKPKAGHKENGLLIKPLSLQQVIGGREDMEQSVTSSEQPESKLSSSPSELNEEAQLPAIAMNFSKKKNSLQPTSLLKSLTIQRSVLSDGFLRNGFDQIRNETIVLEAERNIVSHALTHSYDQESLPSSASMLHFAVANVVGLSIFRFWVCKNYVNN